MMSLDIGSLGIFGKHGVFINTMSSSDALLFSDFKHRSYFFVAKVFASKVLKNKNFYFILSSVSTRARALVLLL